MVRYVNKFLQRNIQFFIDKMGKINYINGIKTREVITMARIYHEMEYTNTIAEVKKHINKICKKEGWVVEYFVWCGLCCRM